MFVYTHRETNRKLLREELTDLGQQPTDHALGWQVARRMHPCFALAEINLAQHPPQTTELTRRMRDDAAAPSRSFLKLEEAFWLLDVVPERGQSAIDMGAAPGGWSWSLAQRGVDVLALDNGPLKIVHPRIRHQRLDAFTYHPRGERYDWLVCDIIEKPERTLAMLENWIQHRWCVRFVITMKTGRTSPLRILRKIRESNLLQRQSNHICRQLFHNREEFTIVGTVRF